MTIEELAEQYANRIIPDADKNDAPYFTSSDRWQDNSDAYLAGASGRWIKVTPETMPEVDGIYLIWDNGYGEAHFKDGIWKDTVASVPSTSPYVMQRFRSVVSPTHWMPLPQPPTE